MTPKRHLDDRDYFVPRLQAYDVKVHGEIEREQVTHIDLAEYTEERVASLLAKVEEQRRYWDVREYQLNR